MNLPQGWHERGTLHTAFMAFSALEGACRGSAKGRQSSHLWQELWSFGALVAAAQATGDKV
jgi:hypothetical protein